MMNSRSGSESLGRIARGSGYRLSISLLAGLDRGGQIIALPGYYRAAPIDDVGC
jgi:hypothetical protein